jgi:tetratricopeptide (TPR) repeat protein
VATGANGAHPVVMVWDTNTGQLVKTLPAVAESLLVGFSPDGNWLAAAGAEPQIWKVPSWEEGPRLAGKGVFAFSPDNKLLALETGWGAVRLVDPSTAKEYARLEDPNQDRARSMTFSPDGRKLVVNGEGQSIHVWDLPAIRAQLADRRLDWELLAYPPADDSRDPALQLVSHNYFRNRGNGYLDRGDWAKAIHEFTQALELDPEGARSLNGLAWSLVSCPDPMLRDPKRGVALAKKGVKLTPNDPFIWNTLGVAHFRAGNYMEAIEALTKSMELQKGNLESFDTFFLAMAHWQLSNKVEAKKWYDRAVEWQGKNKQTDKRFADELHRFQAEAAELLEIKEKKN